MWKIYKEGQGKWSRGLLMGLVAFGAIYLVKTLHLMMPRDDSWSILGWSFDYRWLVDGPLLVGALIFGVWLFNHRRLVDFMVETETELKTKVTWPTREEEINASVVVCVTVVIMMGFIVTMDTLFGLFHDHIMYRGLGG